MLAHTRADVAELNQLARDRMREGGALKSQDQVLQTERGRRAFAEGDRVMFLKNERSMGVKNGSLGTVERVDAGGFAVRLDGPERREVRFELKDYAHIDHGYAATIHKSQGVTVDRAHLLATDGLDRHAAYVGMSRHREAVSVHYGTDDFKDRAQLVRTLSRERAKDTSLDYRPVFAERRGFGDRMGDEVRRLADRLLPREAARSNVRVSPEIGESAERGLGKGPPSRFAGFKPREVPSRPQASPADGLSPDLKMRVRDYARAFADIERMDKEGLPVLLHQQTAMNQARKALEASHPGEAVDLRSALSLKPGLAGRVDQPGGMEAVGKAMALEGRVRLDPELRADRFVEIWGRLSKQLAALPAFGDRDARAKVEDQLERLIDTLGRDPKMGRQLSKRHRELGLPSFGPELSFNPTLGIGQALARSIGLGRSWDRDIDL
jgi:hypothetical protein